jgi:hypothetical protein
LFHYSRDRRAEHPNEHLAHYGGILQADAYGGYDKLYAGDRQPKPLIQALCWAHARRKFFELADIDAATRRRAKGKAAEISPIAFEIVQRIDALFAIEREINGKSADERAS